MKKIILLAMVIGLFISTSVFAEVLALKATWTPNTDSVTTGYKLYRTDGARVLIGTITGKNTSTYNFNVTVPDGSTATLTFVMTGTSATKESLVDSNTASYFFDHTPNPATVTGLGVSQQ